MKFNFAVFGGILPNTLAHLPAQLEPCSSLKSPIIALNSTCVNMKSGLLSGLGALPQPEFGR
jgi:hypothetical protein